MSVSRPRTIRRVGGDRPIPVDVRVVAATNRNLEVEVKKGSFREDLFYRLNVVPIHVPPLRKRKDDIPMLVQAFIEAHNSLSPDSKVKGMDSAALETLRSYNWPGNVRELRNSVSRMISFAENDTLTIEDIPEKIRLPITKAELEIREDLGFKDAKEQWVASFEKQYLQDILKKNNYNISAAAKEAGIDRKSVQRLIRKYDINLGGKYSSSNKEEDEE